MSKRASQRWSPKAKRRGKRHGRRSALWCQKRSVSNHSSRALFGRHLSEHCNETGRSAYGNWLLLDMLLVVISAPPTFFLFSFFLSFTLTFLSSFLPSFLSFSLTIHSFFLPSFLPFSLTIHSSFLPSFLSFYSFFFLPSFFLPSFLPSFLSFFLVPFFPLWCRQVHRTWQKYKNIIKNAIYPTWTMSSHVRLHMN